MKTTKWLKPLLHLLVVGLILWFVWATLVKAVEGLDDYDWSTFSPWWPAWMLLAAVLYAVGLLPMGWFWYRGLQALGQQPRLGETLRAFYIGHIGKYVPGKALVVVLRAGLLRSDRVDTRVAAASVFLETLTMMAVGASLAAAAIAIWFREHQGLMLLAVGLMFAAGLPTVPPIFRRLVLLTGAAKKDPRIHEHLNGLTARLMIFGWISVAGGWLLLSLSLWAVLQAMGLAELNPLPAMPVYVGAVALGMVAGFLSLIPGGVFVRDAIMAEILLPWLQKQGDLASPETAALAAAVLLRLVWLVTEAVLSVMLYFLGPKPR